MRLVLLGFALAAPAALATPELTARVLAIGQTSSERLRPEARLAPGKPPTLAFRYLDGKRRHRFGDLEPVLDDAGH